MADVVVDASNKNPKQLLGQGIKAYVLQNYDAAVSALSKASELLVLEHGDDLHESLGEVYLYYGKALLGLARDEFNVLGDAIPKDNEGSDEGENQEEAAEETDDNPEDVADKPNESETKIENDSEKGGNGENKIENVEEMEENTEDKPENDDEPTDLQVAWEVLELAKNIFTRQAEKGKRHLAETLIVLGEISLENENYPAAIEDITQGLELQKTLFANDSRKIAETYYKLGVAYSTDSQIEEAVKSFNGSLEYLRNRVANLQKIDDKKDEIDEEIKEIQNLIPDIEEKIADMKSYKDEALKQIVSAITQPKAGEGSSSSSFGTNSSAAAKDISHLVKKKRKLDEVVEEKDQEANPAKKPAT